MAVAVKDQKDSEDINVKSKFASRGVGAMTNAELLSIIIGGGTRDRSAIDISKEVMNGVDNNLSELAQVDFSTLRGVLGASRAASVTASFELGRRYMAAVTDSRTEINSMRDVEAIFMPMLVDLPHEEFWAVYLTSSNKIISKLRISHGGVVSTSVDNKLIIKSAIERLAPSILLVHNHPSGEGAPSESDNLLTVKLIEAAKLFDIILMDHVIIAAGGSYSFRNDKAELF